MPRMIDKLDAQLIKLLNEQPRVGLLEIARQLGVARGTVSARPDKLLKRGPLPGSGPEIDPHELGFRILAFVWLEIYQGRLDEAVEQLRGGPEVLGAVATRGGRG